MLVEGVGVESRVASATDAMVTAHRMARMAGPKAATRSTRSVRPIPSSWVEPSVVGELQAVASGARRFIAGSVVDASPASLSGRSWRATLTGKTLVGGRNSGP